MRTHSLCSSVAALSAVLLVVGACHRKSSSGATKGPADPMASPASDMAHPRARPRARPRPTPLTPPPARPRVAPAPTGPTSANVSPGRRPGPTGPEPQKLTAFVKALEATGGKPFAPLPLLKNHLTGVKEGHWVHELSDKVTAKVLRVGKKPLVAAVVLFNAEGYERCDGGDEPLAVTAVEYAGRPGHSQLYLHKQKTRIRTWFKPKILIPPHFARTRAVIVEYEFDDDLENCPKNPENADEVADTRRALFKLGKRRLVQYADYTIEGHGGSPGSRKNTTTQLQWYVSKKQVDRFYLGVVVLKSHRVFSTEGEQKYEEYSCRRSVTVIAMEPGKLWKTFRGRKLAQLRKTEPVLSKLPKKMRGASRKACTF